MTVTGLVLTAAAGGMAAYGQYSEGESQNKYYQYLADSNERQARALQKTAEDRVSLAQNEAANKAKELKGEVASVEGAQKAAMAANGIFGVTAEDIALDTFNKAKLDEGNIRYNADVQSWGIRKEAAEDEISLMEQSGLYRFAGKEARRAARINMTTTLLGTAGSMFLMGSKIPGGGGNSGGKIISTGPQEVAGHKFTTAWSPNKLF